MFGKVFKLYSGDPIKRKKVTRFLIRRKKERTFLELDQSYNPIWIKEKSYLTFTKERAKEIIKNEKFKDGHELEFVNEKSIIRIVKQN